MREPQVVRKSRVHRMSLCAIGMPVSGPASPFARRASARLAALRLFSSSVEMKAFSCRSSFAIRSRQARVSSTDETFFTASAADNSVTVELSKLLDDFGDEVKTLFHRRGRGLVELPPVGFGDFVGAKPLNQVEGVRHRLDAGGIHRPHLPHQPQDAVQALADLPRLAGIQSDAGEAREAADLVVGKRHFFRSTAAGKAGAARGVFTLI